MNTSQLSNTSELLQQTMPKTFMQSFFDCPTHGKSPTNFCDANGVVTSRPYACQGCAAQERAERLLGKSGIRRRFAACSFDNYETKLVEQVTVLESCRRYAAQFANVRKLGTCMIMRGEPGTGKNHLSTSISQVILSQGYSVLLIKATEYLEEYWGKKFEAKAAWVRQLASVDLIILDELGRTPKTDPAENALFKLIDSRYEEVAPTIVTTNLSKEDLRTSVGSASFDRLCQNGSVLLNFDWASYRSMGSSNG